MTQAVRKPDLANPGRYAVSGLILESNFELPATRAADVGQGVTVEIVMGATTDAEYRRPGTEVVAELMVDGWPRYTFARVGAGYVARVYGLGDFEIAGDLSRVICHPDASADPYLIPILVCGTIVSFLLMAAGQMVLHASAVACKDDTIAFVGPPLQGKSTLATLMCAGGARLLADDVLPTFVRDDTVWGVPGTGLLRLRQGATELLDHFPAEATVISTMADDRVGLVPPQIESHPQRLAGIALPRPTRTGGAQLRSRHLSPAHAAFRVAQGCRIEGWREPAQQKAIFFAAGEIASRVPVVELDVPWGPPFPTTLADEIAQALNVALPALVDGQQP